MNPARYENTNAFYSGSVASSVNLSANRYDNVNQFYFASITGAGTNLLPSLLVNTQSFFDAAITESSIVVPSLVSNTNAFYQPLVESDSYLITKAQAIELYNVYLLHGLQNPLVVGPSSRVAGLVNQTVTQEGNQVNIETTSSATSLGSDIATMITELAALYGIGSNLIVTDSSRSSGPVVQSLTSVAGITTVTRQ